MIRRVCLASLALFLALPSHATAQWPVGQGNYWGKVSAFYHEATEEYRSNGSKEVFLNNNAVGQSSALFVEGLVGITNRLDLWLQVPWFDLRFDDDVEKRHSRGFGDVRASARLNLLQLRGGSIPVSVRVTAKAPIEELTIDAEIIPVGEGQWDYEAWLESGISLWPLPAYSVLWLGYRWRTINEDTTRRPGNEFTFLAEFGGTSILGGLGGKLVADGIFGEPGEIQRLQLGDPDRRQILYLAPTLIYSFSDSTILETAIRIPVLGKNFPAGSPMQIGLFHTGRLWN